MIVQLQGKLQELDDTQCVIAVSGVGYALGVSTNTAHALFPHLGEGVTLFTRMIVKENALELYGFETRSERSAFERLIAISSIGPKLALAILSTYSVAELRSIAHANDIDRMSQVSGVGKKKAARILVELADSFAKDKELMASSAEEAAQVSEAPSDHAHELQEEATQALLSMGFTTQEIDLAHKHIQDQGYASLEELIAALLRALGGDN